MAGQILIIDTTVLCCLLKIPGKDTAGPADDRWDFKRIDALLTDSEKSGGTFVLPLATLLETGNHVSQAPANRFELAKELADIITKTADAESPWAAFTDQADLWDSERLKALARTWPKLAAAKMSIGDATIKDVADWYAQAGYNVQIVTGDQGLKAYEPAQPPITPRRRLAKSVEI